MKSVRNVLPHVDMSDDGSGGLRSSHWTIDQLLCCQRDLQRMWANNVTSIRAAIREEEADETSPSHA